MIEKTRGIVLHQIKYTDSGIIVQFYTRKFGRQSFMIRGMRNKKTGKHNIFFQPLYILDLDIYYKESRGMQVIKEFSASFTPSDIQSNIMKGCVAIFLGEVLTSVLKEESPNEELFDFIEESVKYFDSCREGYSNFHIAFLAGLCSYLGFEPSGRSGKDDIFFDMQNGAFVSVPPLHGNYKDPEISGILAAFFASSYKDIDKIILNGSVRNDVLEAITGYYSLHLPGLKKVKSLEVLKEVFS